MDLGLGGRVALVIGASKGLGRAVAHELAIEGASVVMVARGEAALEAARQAMPATAELATIAGDVSGVADIERIVADATTRFGRVDILVNNAGGPPSGRFEDLASAAWDAAFRTTLMSAVELTRRVLPGMRARRWGRILNITSIAVKQPIAGLMLSNSLRAAVVGWARTLADEVAEDGITVNNLLPGYTRTERVTSLAAAAAAREASHRPRRWRAGSARFRCAGWPSHASSRHWRRSSPRIARATSPAYRSPWTGAGPARCSEPREARPGVDRRGSRPARG